MGLVCYFVRKIGAYPLKSVDPAFSSALVQVLYSDYKECQSGRRCGVVLDLNYTD